MKTKKSFKLILSMVGILTLVLLLNSLSGAAPANSSNIGYVDMNKLQDELPDYQHLKSLLKDKESEFKLFQNYVLTQHQNSLKSLKEKADKDKTGKSADEQSAIEKQFNVEVQKKTDETRNQLEEKSTEFKKEIDDQRKIVEAKVQKLISSVAGDKKMSVVLEKTVVFYGGTDITDLVIEKGKKETDTKKK